MITKHSKLAFFVADQVLDFRASHALLQVISTETARKKRLDWK
jgi:hypothetical protein